MPSEFFLSRLRELNERDIVISKAKLKEPAKKIDLSHLRPNKKIRGD